MTKFTKHEKELAQWLEKEDSYSYEERWLFLARKIIEREENNKGEILFDSLLTMGAAFNEIEYYISGVQWSKEKWQKWKERVYQKITSHFSKGEDKRVKK